MTAIGPSPLKKISAVTGLAQAANTVGSPCALKNLANMSKPAPPRNKKPLKDLSKICFMIIVFVA